MSESTENRTTGRKAGIAVTVAAAAAVAAVGGTIYYRNDQEKKAEAARIADLKAKAETVDNEISSLPSDVSLTDEDAVKKASDDYDALVEEAKGYVTQYDTLKDYLQRISDLQAAVEQAKTDAGKTDDLISAIGDVTLESGDKITSARTSYDGLSDEAKAYVVKYDTLTAAEMSYQNLLTAKAEADKAAAEAAARAQAEAEKAAQAGKAGNTYSSGKSSSKSSTGKSSSGKSSAASASAGNASAGKTGTASSSSEEIAKWTDPETGKTYDIYAGTTRMTGQSSAQYAMDHAGEFSLGD